MLRMWAALAKLSEEIFEDKSDVGASHTSLAKVRNLAKLQSRPPPMFFPEARKATVKRRKGPRSALQIKFDQRRRSNIEAATMAGTDGIQDSKRAQVQQLLAELQEARYFCAPKCIKKEEEKAVEAAQTCSSSSSSATKEEEEKPAAAARVEYSSTGEASPRQSWKAWVSAWVPRLVMDATTSLLGAKASSTTASSSTDADTSRRQRRLRLDEPQRAHADLDSEASFNRRSLPLKSRKMKPTDRYGRLIIFGIDEKTNEWNTSFNGQSAVLLYHVRAVETHGIEGDRATYIDLLELEAVAFEDEIREKLLRHSPYALLPLRVDRGALLMPEHIPLHLWHSPYALLPPGMDRDELLKPEHIPLHHKDFFGSWKFADHLIGECRPQKPCTPDVRTRLGGGECSECGQPTGCATPGWKWCACCSADPSCPEGWVPGAMIRQVRTRYIDVDMSKAQGHRDTPWDKV